MQTSQKIGIGAFLCLSICMITIAGIRLSDIRRGGNTVDSWQYFWLEVEACVALCTVSLVAFRYFFVDHGKTGDRRGKMWYSSAVARNLRLRDLRARSDQQGKSMTAPITTLPSSHVRNSWLIWDRCHKARYSNLEARESGDELLHSRTANDSEGIEAGYCHGI